MNTKKRPAVAKAAGAALTVALLICGVLMSSACTVQAKEPEKVVLSEPSAGAETPNADEVTAVIMGEGKEISLSLPVENKHYVSLGFGSYGHEGIDFVSENEGPIYAAADGTVVKAENDIAYGNYVILDHGDGMQTLYAHCSELLVSEGDKAAAGSEIAKIGSTGQSTGPHLHFELRINGEVKDPTDMLPKVLAP